MTQPGGSAPLTDEAVFNQQPDAPAPQPARSVEELVAQSNGQPNNAPIAQLDATPDAGTAPSLDPMPSAPPPAPTPPGPPAPAPEPAVDPAPVPAVPEPDVLDEGVKEPGTDVAVVGSNVELEPWTNDEPWDHQTIEFRGDHLNVRRPTDQALAGLSLSSSKYVKMTTRNDITGLFIARHLSPLSYDRVFARLLDPDDPDYTVETIGELMGAIVGDRATTK